MTAVSLLHRTHFSLWVTPGTRAEPDLVVSEHGQEMPSIISFWVKDSPNHFDGFIFRMRPFAHVIRDTKYL